MTEYRPRVKKTSETWTKLFILARGKMPTEAEIPFADLEDMDETTAEQRERIAKLKVALEE